MIQIFATGSAPADSSAPVKVFLANTPEEVLYSGPVAEFPSRWQINAKVPGGISGQVPLFLAAQNFVSNAATVWVQ